MKLTYTAVFVDLVSDFYQENGILVTCLTVIVLLSLSIMTLIPIGKSKHVQALRRMNEVAEEGRQLQSAFIANMTHEMRTPLSMIVGFIMILAETSNLDREQRMAFLKEINENKDVLLQPVNNLLDRSKIEANTMEHNDGEADVNVLILETYIAENAHSRLPGIQVEFIEKLPQCHLGIDRVRFGQAAGNLIRNVLKFTKQGCMKVGCRRLSDQNFYSCMADTGCGIEEESRRVIPERSVKTNYNIRRTSLGFSIRKSVIKHYGGGVGVESKKGEGPTSHFMLPSKLEYMEYGRF